METNRSIVRTRPSLRSSPRASKELRHVALKRMTLQTEEQLEASKREIALHRKIHSLVPNGVVALLEAQIQPLSGRGGGRWNEALLLFPWLPQSVS